MDFLWFFNPIWSVKTNRDGSILDERPIQMRKDDTNKQALILQDVDVQEERKKIHNMAQDSIEDSALVVKNLTKVSEVTRINNFVNYPNIGTL